MTEHIGAVATPRSNFSIVALLLLVGLLVEHCAAIDNDPTGKLAKEKFCSHTGEVNSQECNIGPTNEPYLDPTLYPMPFEDGEFLAYVQPDVSTFYGNVSASSREVAVNPEFNGIAGKFLNLSPERMQLFWQSRPGVPGSYHGDIGPFQAVGTATFPPHRWYMAKQSNPGVVMFRFVIEAGKSLYTFDPFSNDAEQRGEFYSAEPRSLDDLNGAERGRYDLQKRNLEFARTYREFTGRDWLALYPKRERPRNHMWRADFFGQQHWVESRETHFVTVPNAASLADKKYVERKLADDEVRRKSRFLKCFCSLCSPLSLVVSNSLNVARLKNPAASAARISLPRIYH